MPLADLHEHLEQEAETYSYSHQIADRARTAAGAAGDQAKECHFEALLFELQLQAMGELVPMWTGEDDEGNAVRHPDLTAQPPEFYDYVAGRLEATSNPLLKARYAHALIASERPEFQHNRYYEAAVDAYLSLADSSEARLAEVVEVGLEVGTASRPLRSQPPPYGIRFLRALEAALCLSSRFPARLRPIQERVANSVASFSPDCLSWHAVRGELLAVMLDATGRQRFPAELFVGIADEILCIAERLRRESRFQRAIEFYRFGRRVQGRSPGEMHPWDRLAAECYEALIDEREEGDPVRVRFCEEAIQLHRAAGNDARAEELEQLRESMAASVEPATIRHEVEVGPVLEQYRLQTQEALARLDADGLIQLLMASGRLFYPQVADVRVTAQANAAATPLLSVIPTQIIDREHGGVVQSFHTDAERQRNQELSTYGFYLSFKQLLIDTFMREAVRTGALSAGAVVKYLQAETWLEERWIRLIQPGIEAYFREVEAVCADEGYSPNFILCTDSLVTKIEGMLRDLLSHCGLAPTTLRRRGAGEAQRMRRDLNDLLRQQAFADLFDEDDVMFLQFVLIEHAGHHLRHGIAHGFLPPEGYTIQTAHLAFVCILKIAQWQLSHEPAGA